MRTNERNQMGNGVPKISFQVQMHEPEEAIQLEWLITNGLGGYSSSSITGVNTRKYHGILVASLTPPTNRNVVLSKFDEKLVIDRSVYSLGANEFKSGFSPQLPKHLENFSLRPFPTFTYKMKGIELKKTILMPHGKNAVVIHYEVLTPSRSVSLQMFPIVNSRHFHTVTDRNMLGNGYFKKRITTSSLRLSTPRSILEISASAGQYIDMEDQWIEDLFFRIDSADGTSCFDDCYLPGRFDIALEPGECTRFHILVVAGNDSHSVEKTRLSIQNELRDFDRFYQSELDRTCRLSSVFHLPATSNKKDWLKWLLQAASSFIVHRSSTNTKTVIAGYHWFEDWGRDSLISLPGLTLVTGRIDDAKEILLTFRSYCKNGLIPNRFPDEPEENPTYNTVDATLWYIISVLQYLKYTLDFDFVKEKLWEMLQSVIRFHVKGTMNNIHMDDDCLLAHGPQLTWMDAMLDNNPITPREGKAVEIQALWYNALKIMQLLAYTFEQHHLGEEYRQMARKAKTSFVEKFWSYQRNYLCDVVDREKRSETLRPNQVFAVSLDFPLVDKTKQAAIISTIHEKLWATYGLRTLSPEDSRYIGRYQGSWTERNLAYHNGTVWPWLIGPFVTAYVKVNNFAPQHRKFAFTNFLKPLFTKGIQAHGIGTLSEIYDGNPPHAPRGCISQAWTVAETLRAYAEDIMLKRPKHENRILQAATQSDTRK